MKNFMYSIVAAALLLFAIWAAPPPASANTSPDSMNVEHEKTDTTSVVGIEKVVAESAAGYTQHAQCIDQAESEVFRGACPIGAHSQPTKGFARRDLVLLC